MMMADGDAGMMMADGDADMMMADGAAYVDGGDVVDAGYDGLMIGAAN